MSLPRKKSRPIHVGNIDYRYIVSTSKIDDNWNFKLNVTIQIENGEGAALLVKGLVTRDFWLDFSDMGEYNKHNYPVVLPSHIERLINQAIHNGWVPDVKAPSFILELENKTVFE